MRARQAIRAHLQYVEKDVQASWDRVDAAECTESPASSSFTASINKVLKQTHPHMGLTVEGMHTMQDFVVYLLERLVDAAAAHRVQMEMPRRFEGGAKGAAGGAAAGQPGTDGPRPTMGGAGGAGGRGVAERPGTDGPTAGGARGGGGSSPRRSVICTTWTVRPGRTAIRMAPARMLANGSHAPSCSYSALRRRLQSSRRWRR